MGEPLLSYLEFADPQLSSKTTFSAHVPAGISTSDALLTELSERLRFPDYFGGNWNALVECLGDLEWLPPGDVVLIHEDVPNLDEAELTYYLNIVAEAARDSAGASDHRLRVVFPVDGKFKVARILSMRRTWEGEP